MPVLIYYLLLYSFIPPSHSYRLYLYNGCLALNNVALTLRIHSTVKYSQLGKSANVCEVSNQPTRTLYMWKNRNDNKQGI